MRLYEESGPLGDETPTPSPKFLFEGAIKAVTPTKAARPLLCDLRKAVEASDFELEYQPILDSLTGRVTAFEALLRWRHPLHGRISPADFIPVAERNGLMPRLGAWVLRQACRECAHWPDDIKVSVNMSASQLHDPDVVRAVTRAAAAAGLPPERLQLELTETFLLSDPRALRKLRQLHEAGFTVALDDFGAGYSSLSYLHTFPFDKIKIDRGFVQQTDQCRHSYRMLEALMRFAAVLEVPTVVEGVETAQQLQMIRTFGACEIQGYLFGRPMGPGKIAGFLADRLY